MSQLFAQVINHYLVSFALIFGSFVTAQLLLPRLLGYRLTAAGIELVIFRRWALSRIGFAEIRSIRAVSWRDSLEVAFGQRWSTRLHGDTVQVSRGTGVFDELILTPADSQEFVRAVVRGMARRHSEPRRAA